MEALDMTHSMGEGPVQQKRVGELLTVALPAAVANVCVESVVADSRRVGQGALFLAMPGLVVDGRSYIDNAIRSGAAAVIADADDLDSGDVRLAMRRGVPVIELAGLPRLASSIASAFFDFSGEQLRVIGVTGTNGKTSCSHNVAVLINAMAMSGSSGLPSLCGVVGTLGIGVPGDGLKDSGMTTPDAIATQNALRCLQDSDCDGVAMEVSSHALVQHRVEAVPFDVAIFTNLSRDHLDFHGDMDAYGEAKASLFLRPELRCAVLNLDDSFNATLLQLLPAHLQRLTYSLDNPEADIYACDIEPGIAGISFVACYGDQKRKVQLQQIGLFNLANALAALTGLVALGYPFDDVVGKLSQLRPVSGRMEIVRDGGRVAVIDYSHTPQALELALQALRSHTAGQVICVFGCGGDRDRGKRAEMGRIASYNSDRLFVTSDNPRSESPAQIIDDILLGVEVMDGLVVEPDRRVAIEQALQLAQAGDIVLVAGKGHEEYQEANGVRHAFSDAEVIADYFAGNASC